MSRYQIWNKESQVITPSGEVFTAQEWADKYPMSKIEGVDLVIAGGVINGAFCGEFTSMVEMADRNMRQSGIEEYKDGIPEGLTKQETLDFIEEFEDTRKTPAKVITAEERMASALEAQVLLSLPDAE